MKRMDTQFWLAAWCIVAAIALTTASCKKGDATSSSGGGVPPPGPGPHNSTSAVDPKDVLAKLPGGEEYAAGKKVYAEARCADCHKLGQTGVAPLPPPPMLPGGKGPPGGLPMPPGPPIGPDLTKVGANPEHTTEWLTEQIRNPKTHNPEGRMPVFDASKISDADLKSLVAYLASLK